MEQNFQTSFIPKKPMIEERVTARRPMGIFFIVSLFLFFATLIAGGGAYFYKGILTQNVTKMGSDLNKAKERFEPSRIKILQTLDKRLSASTAVLENHNVVSPIFEVLQATTMKTIRYTDFSFSKDDGKNVKVSIKGQAIGYRSVALQAEILAKNKNIIDPVFSGLSLDDKGNVLFDLEFSVEKNFLDYRQTVKTDSGGVLNTISSPNPSSGANNIIPVN